MEVIKNNNNNNNTFTKMPLNENLEKKRRLNIDELNASGACHLCCSTSGSRSYRSFVGNDGNYDEDNINRRHDLPQDHHQQQPQVEGEGASSSRPMKTCMCYGNSSSWPFSLRVCEMCVTDDVTSSAGRIRSCGICGVIACDEKCGNVQLVECTDKDEWNSEGCLECRGVEGFNQMELFRRRPYPNNIPRATRICTSCLELFSLYSFGTQYQFKCRYFKCHNLLVPSNIVELKRSLTPFPLSELPVELMDSIVDFLGGKDLYHFGQVCSSSFNKVEHVAKGIVMSFNHQLPTGPVRIVRTKQKNVKQKMVIGEGKNSNSLQAPDDEKLWVTVLNQMEQLTREIFYFDFQLKAGDDGAALRYLRNRQKLSFDRIFSRPLGVNTTISPYLEANGLQMRGGQVLVTKYKWNHTSPDLEPGENRRNQNNIRSIIFSTDKVLETGIHRVIIRYYCFCEGDALGSIGLLRQEEDGSVAWQQTCSIVCQGKMEEHIFGMEYNADRRELTMFKKNSRTNKMESTTPGRVQHVKNEGGDICFAAALSSSSIGLKGNQLSIRMCNNEEWDAFLSHTAVKNLIPRSRVRSRRGEERLMRFLEHRQRRALAGGNDNDNNNDHDDIENFLLDDMEDDIVNDSDSDFDELDDDGMDAEDYAGENP